MTPKYYEFKLMMLHFDKLAFAVIWIRNVPHRLMCAWSPAAGTF